jgi:galactokinase
MSTTIVASAPARADFLNTHQDYKGLSVVPVGLNLRVQLVTQVVDSDTITVRSHALERYGEPSTDSFRIGTNQPMERGFFGNYFRAVLNVLAERQRLERIRGMEIDIRSGIPIGSGLASSAALEVAFAALLNHVGSLDLSRREIAEISYMAENGKLGIPCGRLDQYGVSFGGIIKLDCKPPFNVEPLPFQNLIFAIADSGIRHSTLKVHLERQNEINKGLNFLMDNVTLPRELRAKLGYRLDQVKWDEIRQPELDSYLATLDENPKRRILFTFRMNRSTNLAIKVLKRQPVTEAEIASGLGESVIFRLGKIPLAERDYWLLGEIMNEQHALLRDLYDVSLPRIEDICASARDAGAYGAKISGAGMGGSIIALVKDMQTGRRVVDACKSVGASDGWVSSVAEGVEVQPEHVDVVNRQTS